MALPKIAILASGNGTTAESFIRSVVNKDVPGEVALVICNKKDAGVFKRVEKLNDEYGLNIKTKHIGSKNFSAPNSENTRFGRQTPAEEKAILEELSKNNIDLVLLLGYMKLVGSSIVEKYGWSEKYDSVYKTRMINTHPGLLPATKGLYGIHVQQKVIREKLKAGHCLFAVDNEYDDGPVISEHQVAVKDNDTAEELFERVKDSEKKYLTQDIREFINAQKSHLAVK